MVCGWGVAVWGLAVRFWSLWFRVQGLELGFRMYASSTGAVHLAVPAQEHWVLGFEDEGLWCRGQGHLNQKRTSEL